MRYVAIAVTTVVLTEISSRTRSPSRTCPFFVSKRVPGWVLSNWHGCLGEPRCKGMSPGGQCWGAKLLEPISWSGNRRWKLWVPNLQKHCGDRTRSSVPPWYRQGDMSSQIGLEASTFMTFSIFLCSSGYLIAWRGIQRSPSLLLATTRNMDGSTWMGRLSLEVRPGIAENCVIIPDVNRWKYYTDTQ